MSGAVDSASVHALSELARPDRQPFVRISVQGYNTREDVDALVGALGALLPQVVEERDKTL